jgi:beta-N-acetylhexosaminidase
VLDLLDEQRAQFSNALQTRVLGYTPEEITHHATAYLEGLQGAGVLGCVKHFPGLGAGAIDSHEDLPLINLSRQEMQDKDLAPYTELFASGLAQAVMVAHGYYPQLSPHDPPLPSSLDGHIINGLLRREMGWAGLVMSDDLEMGAIARHATIEQAVVQHLQAGSDMLLICATPDLMRRGYYAVLEAVQRGDISAAQVQASLARIAAVKARTQPPAEFDAARWQALANEVAALNQTLN